MTDTPKRRGRPPAKPQIAPRRQWEYEKITAQLPFARQDLDAMGVGGWELVTIYVHDEPMHGPIYYAVFKRELLNA